jgi:hypothetical protein
MRVISARIRVYRWSAASLLRRCCSINARIQRLPWRSNSSRVIAAPWPVTPRLNAAALTPAAKQISRRQTSMMSVGFIRILVAKALRSARRVHREEQPYAQQVAIEAAQVQRQLDRGARKGYMETQDLRRRVVNRRGLPVPRHMRQERCRLSQSSNLSMSGYIARSAAMLA